jgi:hypothetical protein
VVYRDNFETGGIYTAAEIWNGTSGLLKNAAHSYQPQILLVLDPGKPNPFRTTDSVLAPTHAPTVPSNADNLLPTVTGGTSVHGSTSNNSSLPASTRIAIGVAVPVIILMGVMIVLMLCFRRRKQKTQLILSRQNQSINVEADGKPELEGAGIVAIAHQHHLAELDPHSCKENATESVALVPSNHAELAGNVPASRIVEMEGNPRRSQ